MDLYVISFENGSNLFINAKSMVDAVGDGVDSLLKCLPAGFGAEHLRPTAVRWCGDCCTICGKKYIGDNFMLVPAEGVHLGMKICLSCAGRLSLVFCNDE
jgi:hypothetical protein